MIYVSNEFKEAFLSAAQKNLKLVFDDGTILGNVDIAFESMNLEQTLCENDELKFGKVSSACFKTKIPASTKRYKNLWFNASIGVGEHEIQLGRFKVYTDNMTSDRLYRDIVAYDTLFWAINTDVTEWYNGLTFPITQKAFRDSLFSYLGIEQESVILPNDSILFNKTIDVENLTGLTVLQALCELNATWGVINHNGKFKYARMRTHEHDALYPSDDLYPSNDIFPDDIYDDKLSKANYYQGSLKYEEYDTQPISKVTIREDSEDLGYSYGSDGNTYVIEANILMYGATNSTLQTVAKNFYEYASYIAYTPSEMSCKGAPWREVGDLLLVVADKRTLTMPILNRQLSGITALKDTYIARGTETYSEVINSPKEQIKKLQSRTNKFIRTLDETRSEIDKVEKNLSDNYSTTSETKSLIKQTSDEINLEIESIETKTKKYADTVANNAETNANKSTDAKLKSYSTTTQMNSAINQKADEINLSVEAKISETKTYADNKSSEALENANNNTDNKLKSYSTTTEMNSAINLSIEGIKSEVNKTIEATASNLQSQIDGAIETFTGSAVPTLNNAPANSWTTNAIKDTHIGDLYVVNSSGGDYAGFYYRFEKSGTTYQWTLLKDSEVTKALQDAKEANDKANAVADDLSTNYSKTTEMNSAIEQKADSILSSVNVQIQETKNYADDAAENAKTSANNNTTEKLKSYSTTTQMNTAINQKANEINLSVNEKIAETKEYADTSANNAKNNAISDTTNKLKSYSTTTQMNTAIQQKANEINLSVDEKIEEAKTYADTAATDAKNNANENTETLLKNYSTTTEMNSAINQKADSITSSVNTKITETKTYANTVAINAKDSANATTTEKLKSYSTTTEMNTVIEQKADEITSLVAKNQNTWNIDYESWTVDLYGYGEPANDTAVENIGKNYLDQETGILYSVITMPDDGGYAWTIIAEFESYQSEMSSEIAQNAIDIRLRVKRDEVVSEINQSADTIELKGDRVIIESTKWIVNESGSQTCGDITITGGSIDVTASSGVAVVTVRGDTYISQLKDDGIYTSRPDWGNQVNINPNGMFVYDENGTRTVDIVGYSNGRINAGGVSTFGTVWTTDLIADGTKNRLVKTENYKNRLLYCYEMSSPMFGDIGEGRIDETGKSYIFLDDIFGETIDTDCVYQVFLQAYGKGECYVTERTSSYFIVEGTENLAFSWEIKAIQRDYDTMRLEEYEENEQSGVGNILAETYGYLNTLLYDVETEAI